MPPRGESFGARVVKWFGMAIFALSILLNIYLLILLAGTMGRPVVTEVLQKGDKRQTVAVVELRGIIGSTSSERMRTLLKQIRKDKNVRALLLVIDSPGGAVTASDAINSMLRKFRRRTGRPVVVSMESVAASGGYYVAVAADRIVAEPTTITGSIGVIAQWPKFNEGLKKYVDMETMTSSQARFKDVPSSWRDLTEEQRKYLQSYIDRIHERFVEVVRRCRSNLSAEQLAKLADGRIYLGPEAKRLGLVDVVGYRDDAVEQIKKLASLQRPRLVRYDTPPSLLRMIGLGASAPRMRQSRPARVALPDGRQLRRVLNEASVPQFMYLWVGQ